MSFTVFFKFFCSFLLFLFVSFWKKFLPVSGEKKAGPKSQVNTESGPKGTESDNNPMGAKGQTPKAPRKFDEVPRIEEQPDEIFGTVELFANGLQEDQ